MRALLTVPTEPTRTLPASARWTNTRRAGLGAVAVTLTSAARSVRARCLRRRPAQPPTVLTDDAVPLHVEVDGQPDANLTVVLVHGYGSRLQEWHHQRRALAPHARIVLFDQRGHGRSGWGHHGRATVDQLGSDLLRVIETHGGPGPVMLVGHSMGGISVLALAAANPALFGSEIAAAALISTSAGHLMEIGVSRQAARLLRHTHALHPFLWLLWCLAPLLDQASPFSTDRGRRLLARRLFENSDAPAAALDRTQESFRTTRLSVLAAFAPSLLHHDEAAALPALRRCRCSY